MVLSFGTVNIKVEKFESYEALDDALALCEAGSMYAGQKRGSENAWNMIAVTDSETGRCVYYDKEKKPGVSNLMQIYASCTGKSFETIEAEFDGLGYGAFKTAVGEAVVETLRPIREKAEELLRDKAYLESIYRDGAARASRTAERTLASGTTVKTRRPLVIPDDQMEQFMQWHAVEDDHKCFVPLVEAQFKLGMEVEITQGKFAGLRGRVARLRGQTRVAIRIDGLGTIFTAYIPKPFLRALHEGEPEQPQK